VFIGDFFAANGLGIFFSRSGAHCQYDKCANNLGKLGSAASGEAWKDPCDVANVHVFATARWAAVLDFACDTSWVATVWEGTTSTSAKAQHARIRIVSPKFATSD
jgi:hypothetical protein